MTSNEPKTIDDIVYNRIHVIKTLRENEDKSIRAIYSNGNGEYCALGAIFHLAMEKSPHEMFDMENVCVYLGLSRNALRGIEVLHDRREFGFSKIADVLQLVFALTEPVVMIVDDLSAHHPYTSIHGYGHLTSTVYP